MIEAIDFVENGLNLDAVIPFDGIDVPVKSSPDGGVGSGAVEN